jgi:hypothetical protein
MSSSIIAIVIILLPGLGIGTCIIINALKLSKITNNITESYGQRFSLWVWRIFGICIIGFTLFCVYLVLFS